MTPTDANRAEAVEYERIIALFTGENSHEMHERHISAIERLCNSSTTGVAIRDLPKVQKIMELTFELIRNGMPKFIEPACSLLRTLSKPYSKKSSTDEFKMPGHIVSILAAVGQVFSAEFPHQLQMVAAEMMLTFVTAQGNRPSVLELETSKKIVDAGSSQRQYHMNQELLAQSGAISFIIRGLATAILGGDQVLMGSLVYVLLNCSYLQSNCFVLLDAGVLACLPALLSVDYKHELASPSIELLWNLLEFAPAETKASLAKPQPMLTRLIMGKAGARVQRADGAGEGCNGPGPAADSLVAESSGAVGNGGGGAEEGAQGAPEPSDTADAVAAEGEPSGLELVDGGASGSQVAQGEPSSLEAEDLSTDGKEMVTSALAEALVTMFRVVLAQGCRRSDKELRNDLLVVINHLLGVTGFSTTDLFGAVLAVSVSPELAAGTPHVQKWALTTEECDMELRLLSWKCACMGAKLEPEVLQLAVDHGLLRVLLMHVDLGAEGASSIARWNSDQLATLRGMALSRLHELAPLAARQYVGMGGFSVVLAYLSESLAAGPAGSGPSREHTLGCLRLLNKICSTNVAMSSAFGTVTGAIAVLIELVARAPQDSPKPDGGIRHQCLILLSVLCSTPPVEGGDTSNIRIFRQEGGVQMLIDQLRVLHRSEHMLPSPYAVALIDAVWRCVVPDKKSTARFLVDEGLDVMLKVLEVCNRSLRPIIVSALADMFTNPKTHPFFHDWRSDLDKKTAAHMLIGIWQEEDALRGMTKQGRITNTSRPLTGTAKRNTWVPSEALAYGNLDAKRKDELALIQEACTGDKLLEKLYAVFKVLGMDSMPYLSVQDQAQLCMVEKYVKFRQGEVWREIDAELEAEGIRPTSPDRVRLDSGIELAEHIARAVVDAQSAILGRYTASIASKEQKYLDNMLAQRNLEQEMRFYQKDRSQLTLAEMREAKQKKEEMLQNSIRSYNFAEGELEGLQEPPGVAKGRFPSIKSKG